MFKKILIGLALAVAILVVVILLQPDDFKVTRSITINAKPEAAFALVNDFKQWYQWSPWDKLDPKMVKTFEGPPSGTGAIYRWKGNSEAGEGEITITESKPAELVRMNLHFIKPWEATSQTEFTFQPEGPQQTKVTWTMSGENTFMGKAICLFMSMDKMIGGDFEEGLEKMKEAAEAPATL